jgi:hypothetical protein
MQHVGYYTRSRGGPDGDFRKPQYQVDQNHWIIEKDEAVPLESLREICRALTLLCTELDLFGGELVAF